MLVLTRKPAEDIILNDGHRQILITVCGVQGNQVKLGIDAPSNMNIVRSELLTRQVEKGIR